MSYQSVSPINLLSFVLMLAVIMSVFAYAQPQFAGTGFGPTAFFAEGAPSGETGTEGELANEDGVKQAQEPEAQQDIQQAAAERVKKAEEQFAQGKSAPELPATSENIARVADPKLVPESDRQAFEYKDDEAIKRAQEEQATKENRQQAIEAHNGAPTSVPTDGAGNSEGGEPTYT